MFMLNIDFLKTILININFDIDFLKNLLYNSINQHIFQN